MQRGEVADLSALRRYGVRVAGVFRTCCWIAVHTASACCGSDAIARAARSSESAVNPSRCNTAARAEARLALSRAVSALMLCSCAIVATKVESLIPSVTFPWRQPPAARASTAKAMGGMRRMTWQA